MIQLTLKGEGKQVRKAIGSSPENHSWNDALLFIQILEQANSPHTLALGEPPPTWEVKFWDGATQTFTWVLGLRYLLRQIPGSFHRVSSAASVNTVIETGRKQN